MVIAPKSGDINRERDHLFISYAWEDSQLANWLAFKLTNEGYNVWYDKYKLLGGESYPRDIDAALKENTFRVIALLSKHSVKKANPIKERTLAMNLSKERNEDFLIPIKVDDIKPTELDWMTSDLTYISFTESWADGLTKLLEKLKKITAPKSSEMAGKELVSKIPFENELKYIKNEDEKVYSNLIKFDSLPENLKKINFKAPLNKAMISKFLNTLPAWFIDKNVAISFFEPSTQIKEESAVSDISTIAWRNKETIEGMRTTDLIKILLFRTIESKFWAFGLKKTSDDQLYFPAGLLKSDNFAFNSYDGKKTRFRMTNIVNKKHPGNEYRWHLSPLLKILIYKNDYFLQLSVKVYLTDAIGMPLNAKAAISKRKRLCKSWWNKRWFMAYFACKEILKNANGKISIENCGQTVSLSSDFITYTSPIRIVQNFTNVDNAIRELIVQAEETDEED